MTKIALVMGRFILTCLVGTILGTIGAAHATTIKKCQDASGKWHYGDYAAQECARSRITEIDQRGLKVKEHEVPPSDEEIEAQKAAKLRQQEQQKRAAEQRRAEDRLLTTYDSEQSIERARDEKLAAIDKLVKHNEYYMAKLQNDLRGLEKQAKKRSAEDPPQDVESLREQILDYEKAIDSRLRERDEVIARYSRVLERYRDILKRRRTELEPR